MESIKTKIKFVIELAAGDKLPSKLILPFVIAYIILQVGWLKFAYPENYWADPWLRGSVVFPLLLTMGLIMLIRNVMMKSCLPDMVHYNTLYPLTIGFIAVNMFAYIAPSAILFSSKRFHDDLTMNLIGFLTINLFITCVFFIILILDIKDYKRCLMSKEKRSE